MDSQGCGEGIVEVDIRVPRGLKGSLQERAGTRQGGDRFANYAPPMPFGPAQ